MCTDPALAQARKALFLEGAALLADEDYQPILDMEQRAMDLGYPELN